MKYKILYTNSYIKQAAKFIKKHPEIIRQYEKVLKLLELDPFHPSLHLHKLSGNLKDLHSVSINLSYRMTMELLISAKTIIPVKIGTHGEAYS